MQCSLKMRKEASNPESNYQDGQWNLVHLKFLTDFMEETGLTTASVAELVGISRQAVYYWFKKDNVRISMIYKLFEAYGYRTDAIELVTPDDTPKNLLIRAILKKPRDGEDDPSLRLAREAVGVELTPEKLLQ